MIVISNTLVLAEADEEFGADNPVVGWHNLVTASNIVADSEEDDNPAVNLANPATHLLWRSETDDEQYLTIEPDYVGEIDYLAVAGHNFATGEIPVSVEGLANLGDSPDDWFELVQDVMLPDDGPALFRFDPQPLAAIRLRMQAGADEPEAAVIYVGKLLVIERRLYVGHTPLKYARKSRVVNGMSESGKFLGRIELGRKLESSADFSLIDPDWYREHMDPFIAAAHETPFFFAWRPQSYPRECGYAWMIGDPIMVPAAQSHLLEISLPMQGIVT